MFNTRMSLDLLKIGITKPENVRNICILAHVDHGKTTISDSLLASNGLLSKRSVGQIRYLDDRKDEQEKGITMKSSAVTLYYSLPYLQTDLLLNLVDTPGHIDFSSEVSSAVRICDGCLVVVDVVEGVCVQTRDVIRQAFHDHLKMILVINKIDRLIVELDKSVNDIFQSILHVIEDCNAVIAELCQYSVNSDEESDLFLFSPEKGNVIFSSALDGWGVTTGYIAQVFLDIIPGETQETLNKKIWNFDYYVDSNTKRILAGAIDKGRENLFIQLFLKTIHYVYHTFIIRMDRENVDMILKKLKIKTPSREMFHNDPHIQVKAILSAWSPITSVIMKECHKIIPSPCNISINKIQYLICGNRYYEDTEVKYITESTITAMQKYKEASTTIVYVSKMFSVDKKRLSQNKSQTYVIQPHKFQNQKFSHKLNKMASKVNENKTKRNDHSETIDSEKENTNVIIGLGRVFSGGLKKGQELFYIDSSISYNFYKPKLFECEAKRVVINDLYLLVGRELVLVDYVPFGNVCGIGGLHDVIERTGTLASTELCMPIVKQTVLEPIVRNTIEPLNTKDQPELRKALRLLMQSDSCVRVVMQETGEMVLITAGDVHLSKCLEDLKKYIDFDINVSRPTVCLRETILPSKKVIDSSHDVDYFHDIEAVVDNFTIKLRVGILSIPSKITKFVEFNYEVLRLIEEENQKDITNQRQKLIWQQNEQTINLIIKLKEQLKIVFESCDGVWREAWKYIWRVGKINDSTNILFNCTKDQLQSILSMTLQRNVDMNFGNDIVNGFEMCCYAGPICEEPLINCAFFIKNIEIVNISDRGITNQYSVTNLAAAIRTVFREVLERETLRLAEPIFITEIKVNTSILGKFIYYIIFHFN